MSTFTGLCQSLYKTEPTQKNPHPLCNIQTKHDLTDIQAPASPLVFHNMPLSAIRSV